MRKLLTAFLMMTAGLGAAVAQAHPRDSEIHDSDTKAWWHTTEDLSGDSMEGRDTGTAAYQRGAEYVAKRFKAAGLKPAGEGGGYFQTVPMHEVAVVPEGTSFKVERAKDPVPLEFLREIMVTPSSASPLELKAAMTFRGYCGSDAMKDVRGKIVVCFGTQRRGLPSGGERYANAMGGGAVGLINVDDPYFSIEPPRWPYAYARTVTAGAVQTTTVMPGPVPVVMRISAVAFTKLLAGSGQDPEAVLRVGGAKEPLPSFEVPGVMHVVLHRTTRELSSSNVLGALPGSDSRLLGEYVVVAAHLDGYGFGTPVGGDNLYNGTLDDAAYVALIIQLADDIKAGKLAAPKRSILFCAFTGEEKGLLGSTWFVQHPTVPKDAMVADINLDQLRPLFPLTILTALAIDTTTLGKTAREVGASMGIELRGDREPERGLLRRADHAPFLQAGIPAIGFIFGFDPGTDEERRYREWYQVRYHRPQDDLTQPVNFGAAAKFNAFFYKLTEAVANGAERPQILMK